MDKKAKRIIPACVAIFIIADTMAADFFVTKNPSLVYTKLAWLDLVLLALLPNKVMTLAVILSLAALHSILTLSPAMFFYNFPAVFIALLWLGTQWIEKAKKRRLKSAPETKA